MGKRGGRARAESMTPERRTEIAKKGCRKALAKVAKLTKEFLFYPKSARLDAQSIGLRA